MYEGSCLWINYNSIQYLHNMYTYIYTYIYIWPSVGSSVRLPVVSSVRVIAQAISRRALTVKARVRSHPSLYGFCGEKVAVRQVCLRVVRLFPVSLIPSKPQLYRFTYRRGYIIAKINGFIKYNTYRKILIFPS